MDQIVCEVTDLSHRYQYKYLFQKINIEFQAGRLNIITGNNGSGKSTFLKIVSKALEPTSGIVNWKGNAFSQSNEIQNKIAFVAPYSELPEELTLAELIEFQNGICSIGEEQALYKSLIHDFGLHEKLNYPIRLFSTGMRQKAKIILALGLNRPVLILDEPTSNLDKNSSEILWDFLEKFKSMYLILIATNDPEEMKKGQILIRF